LRLNVAFLFIKGEVKQAQGKELLAEASQTMVKMYQASQTYY
jgi:hypothetical protein